MEYTLFLFLVFCFLIRATPFQTWLAQEVASYMSGELNTTITIDKVEIRFFTSADLKGFYMEDQRSDTLLYTSRMRVELKNISLKKQTFNLKRAVLEDPRIKLKTYKGEEALNIQFLSDYFSSDDPDTTVSKKIIHLDKLIIRSGRLTLVDENDTAFTPGMNFSNLDLYALNLEAGNFGIQGDTTIFGIEELAFREKSGFDLKRISSSQVRIAPDGVRFKHFYLLTKNSELSTEFLEFNTRSFADFNDFENAVKMKVSFLDPSMLNLADIAYFVPDLLGIDHPLEINGLIRGRVSNLKTKDLYVKVTDGTYFRASLDMNGLPDIHNTFISVSIDQLKTSKAELEKIRVPPYNEEHFLDLPNNLSELGDISFNGNFMGFVNEFVAYGDLETQIGRIKSDIQFRLDTSSSNLTYKGKLLAYGFDIGKFYQVPNLGKVSADLRIDTAFGLDFDELHAEVSGDITSAELNGYAYSNMRMKGEFEKDFFFGELEVHDPNIDMRFEGDLDFSGRLPRYNFDLQVDGANLYPLNILKRDFTASICANVHVDAVGSNLDNFSGEVDVREFNYYESGIDHYFGDILVKTYEADSVKNLALNSDFLYAEIYGKYNFENLPAHLQFMASSVMPALLPLDQDVLADSEEAFDMTIRLDDPDRLTGLFIPELQLSKGTELYGEYNSLTDDMLLRLNAYRIQYNGLEVDQLSFDAEKHADFVLLNSSANNLLLNEGVSLQHLNLSLLPYQDNIDAAIKWNNNSRNWGDINLSALLEGPEKLNMTVKGSSFSIDSLEWIVNERAYVDIDSSSFTISSLTLENEKRSICLEGVVSENPSDEVVLTLSQIDLSLLKAFLPDDMEVKGMLQGEASVGNVYNQVYFSSDLKVDGLGLNKYELGNLVLNNQWEHETNRIRLGGILSHKELDRIGIKGSYYPLQEGNELDIQCGLSQLDLSFLNTFLPEGDFEGMQGSASGAMSITGALSSPQMEGELDFKDGRLKVNYLNTLYAFSGQVGIQPDMFTMDYIPLSYVAPFNNGKPQKAYLSGSLVHDNFTNMSYDVFMDFQNLLLMNTSYDQNPYFYGKAFGSGYLTFFGFDDNIEITVSAKTGSGTKVYLPLYGSEDVVLQDFVSFVNDTVVVEDEHTVDLEGITMNLELDVTPEAEVEIQFDPAIGDLMTGAADGHLTMKIDPLGYFSMFGDLEIMRGEYLFTLYNIVNKKFVMKPGGTIRWETGDPYDARVDLTAIYSLKTSLHNLMVEEANNYTDIVPVNCYMNLRNELFNPEISFDIEAPKSDGNVEGAINRIRQDETELNRQIFSLMVINKFSAPSYAAGGGGVQMGGAVAATTIEMLNNQLSNWLSNISDEFDLGFNYQPGDAISNEEVALAFETQLLNDRLLLSGNFGVSYGSVNTENPNQLIGDFNAEYKVDDNTRLRVFNESNDFDITRAGQAPYTQGVGVYYRKEFNKFKDIGWIQRLFGGKDKENKKAKKKKGEPTPDSTDTGAIHFWNEDQEEDSATFSTISNP